MPCRHLLALTGLVAASLATAASGGAVERHARVSSGGIERLDATGAALVVHRAPARVRGPAPRTPRAAGFARFMRAWPGSWTALWDEDTGSATRVFGAGIPAPGAVHDAAVAESHARAMIAAHADLLAPGVLGGDLEPAANEERGGLRTVTFTQRSLVAHGGGVVLARVVGGQLGFRYENDRLVVIAAETAPAPAAAAATVSGAHAAGVAARLLARSHRIVRSPEAAPELTVLPGGREPARTTWRVRLDVDGPRARYDVYVDAEQGVPVAREQLLHFGGATLLFDAPLRAPDTRGVFPARLAAVVVDGVAGETDASGHFVWAGSLGASVAPSATGSIVQVSDLGDDPQEALLAAEDGLEVIWSRADEERGDAQLSAFVHAGIVGERMKQIAPALEFPGGLLRLKVNVPDDDGCNAYWDGTYANFLVETVQCHNSARVADIVYHEFGHGFHQHAVIAGAGTTEAALGEGAADYLAATITGDPTIAPRFFLSGAALREIEPDRRWPDDIHFDPHETGLIFAGAMWDLRTLLVAELGSSEGVALADHLFYEALRRSSSIPATYAEILAADDDDGDLSNGTPHACQVSEAFGRHGLAPGLGPSVVGLRHEPLSVVPAGAAPYPLRVDAEARFPQCGEAAPIEVSVSWRTAGGSERTFTLDRDGDSFVGTLPGQFEGTAFSYRLTATSAGDTVELADNAADPRYRAFTGTPRTIHCSDFEAGPEGYTFTADEGEPVTEAHWGAPSGADGDPSFAFSGASVIGEALGDDGAYARRAVSTIRGPRVQLGGERNVRLQLRRWLTVEDGRLDQAAIYVNDRRVWENTATGEHDGQLDHVDREWRFEDIDLTPVLGADDHVEVRFELVSDSGVQLGGWTLDDICVVAWTPEEPQPPATSTGGGEAPREEPRGGDPGCACDASGSERGGPRAWSPALLAAAALALRAAGRRPRTRRSRCDSPSIGRTSRIG